MSVEVALAAAPNAVVGVQAKAPEPSEYAPQERTPVVEDFTSQLAALRPEIVRAVVEALPALSTMKTVVDAEFVTSNARTPAVVLAPHTESLLYGVVVPMPTLPEFIIERVLVLPLV